MGATRLAVGKITRAHGIRGEVAVLVLTEVASRFDPDAVLVREDGSTLTVESSRPHRGGRLVRFREVPDRTVAERLAGEYLFVAVSEVPELPEGSFWPHELVGCRVVTDDGRSLGEITEVLHTAANDIWVAVDEGRETLVPALREVILSVDLAGRQVQVRSIPGLTAPEVP